MKACFSAASNSWANLAVELYGWESDGQFWHGPTELTAAPTRRLALDPACALCTWTTNSRLPDGLSVALATTVRDLGDCAVATIDANPSCPGPASIIVAVPANRLPSVRPEFAFELTAFVRFLEGPNSIGTELAIHDHIERVLADARRRSVVFVLCSRSCSGDLSIAVSAHIEQLARALVHWLLLRDSNSRPRRPGPRLVKPS